MNFLSDVITYIRRLIKSPSDAVITDNLIIDYINRFYNIDVSSRMQLFDLKTTYSFQTIPGIISYNMPLYTLQLEGSNPSTEISYYPVYQGFMSPLYLNGINSQFYTELNAFRNLWPSYVQSLNPSAYGNGTVGPYIIPLAENMIVPGYIDTTGIVAAGNTADPIFSTTIPTTIPYTSFHPRVWFTANDAVGNSMTVQDSGVFLSSAGNGLLYGLLMTQETTGPGQYSPPNPYNYQVYSSYSATLNSVDYLNGTATVTFPNPVPDGQPINSQCIFFQSGLPRAALFYNNCLEVLPPPNISYNVEISAYLTPAAFMASSQSLPFAYMAEYIARGAARKILSDTGDVEQFMFYEPLFREQEMLVWKRSQRQFTSTRTPTIYSDSQGPGYFGQGTNLV